jgi:hypothetical protein
MEMHKRLCAIVPAGTIAHGHYLNGATQSAPRVLHISTQNHVQVPLVSFFISIKQEPCLQIDPR